MFRGLLHFKRDLQPQRCIIQYTMFSPSFAEKWRKGRKEEGQMVESESTHIDPRIEALPPRPFKVWFGLEDDFIDLPRLEFPSLSFGFAFCIRGPELYTTTVRVRTTGEG